MNAVDAFRINVNAMTESAKEPTTTYGVHRLLPEAEEPITTGNTGKMHGARTVRMPAKNETTRNAILFYFRKDRGQRCRIAELLY